jgi:hypothetical protein
MTEQAREHLSRLADELDRRGLRTWLTGDTLCAANPACGLTDSITCRPDGTRLAFVWSSGHPIGSISDLDIAVGHIQHVLRDVAEETS